jgi:hypothetical protein
MRGLPLNRMRYRGDDIAGDIREKYGFDGDLVDIFTGIEGASLRNEAHPPVFSMVHNPEKGG